LSPHSPPADRSAGRILRLLSRVEISGRLLKSCPGHHVNSRNTCRHRTQTGRRCRLAALPNSVLCSRRTPLPDSHNDTSDLSRDLLGELPAGQLRDLKSPEHVNECLSKILVLLAHGHISPRPAGVLTFSCSQLLRSVSAMQREEDNEPRFIVDMRLPERDPVDPYGRNRWPSDSSDVGFNPAAPRPRTKILTRHEV